ncbi:MAG: hypothetical protein GF416_05465 [Candidatus Altiarchaeales archaeon]|nr:hypothetical protein [Candidatus Altiarchaeales archaeon]MBD3416566.1 hypothetical protein [Candidatus Altiarchaeales archaeon]
MRHSWIVAFLLVFSAGLYVFGSGAFLGGPADDSSLEGLKSLPYVQWSDVEEGEESLKGVVNYERGKAYPGYNLFNYDDGTQAQILDMEGRVVHIWHRNRSDYRDHGWNQVRMDDEGNLYAIVRDKALLKLDWDSNVLWSVEVPAHHDVAFSEDGSVYVYTRKQITIDHDGGEIPILNDYITVLSPDGSVVKALSVYGLFSHLIPQGRLDTIAQIKGQVPPERLNIIKDTIFDVFHSNTLEVIDRPIPGLCDAGALLVSIREINTIALVDVEGERVLWSWGQGVLDGQHHPTLLDGGRILLFDNGRNWGYSRVIEVDPLSGEIVWEYKGEPPTSFYSEKRGAAQRLPNGNTLITESDRGHVFEITPDKEIVWEYYSTEMNIVEMKRRTIYRFLRLTPEDVENTPLAG